MQPQNPAPTVPVDTPPVPVEPPKPVDARKDPDMAMLEPGECVITVVHRHPIGIVAIYLVTLLGVGALIALVMFTGADFFRDLSPSAYHLFLAGVIVAITLLALVLFVATYIYRQSRLIVSDKSLIQIIQRGLFVRKVSRLSMSNVQDVSADHNGFLPTILGYGTLTVETAGEEDNFVFPYCPTPDDYAERILRARQAYVQSLDDAERASEPG